MYISNKGCRLAYLKTECGCPEKRCWVKEQRQRQDHDLPYESFEDWKIRVKAEE